jgi:hypothetical protein
VGTKIIVGWVLALLIAIGVAVGIMSAVWSPPPSGPNALALAYLADVRSGNCAGIAAMLYPAPARAATIPCPHDPTLSAPAAVAVPTDRHVPGFSRVYDVQITFRSAVTGWVAYAPSGAAPLDLTTVTGLLTVGELPDGQYRLVAGTTGAG